MNRIIGVVCSFAVVGLMLLADSLESSSVSNLGSVLWMVAIVAGALVLGWQAKRTSTTPVILIVAFIPFFNLLLIPLVSIIIASQPTKTSKAKK